MATRNTQFEDEFYREEPPSEKGDSSSDEDEVTSHVPANTTEHFYGFPSHWKFDFVSQSYSISIHEFSKLTLEEREREIIWDPEHYVYIPVEDQPQSRPWEIISKWDEEANIFVITKIQKDIWEERSPLYIQDGGGVVDTPTEPPKVDPAIDELTDMFSRATAHSPESSVETVREVVKEKPTIRLEEDWLTGEPLSEAERKAKYEALFSDEALKLKEEMMRTSRTDPPTFTVRDPTPPLRQVIQPVSQFTASTTASPSSNSGPDQNPKQSQFAPTQAPMTNPNPRVNPTVYIPPTPPVRMQQHVKLNNPFVQPHVQYAVNVPPPVVRQPPIVRQPMAPPRQPPPVQRQAQRQPFIGAHVPIRHNAPPVRQMPHQAPPIPQRQRVAQQPPPHRGQAYQQHREPQRVLAHSDTSTTSSSRDEVSDNGHPRMVQGTLPCAGLNPPGSNVVWKRLEMGTPQQDQISNKEKLVKTQTASITQQSVLVDLFEKIQPRDCEPAERKQIKELLDIARKGILSQQEQMEQSQAEIIQSKQVASFYSPSLAKPDLYEYTDMSIPGTKEALQAKNIKATIDTFNPDKYPESDFSDTWRQILLYTQNYKLDEKAYMNILTILIQGKASREIYDMGKSQTPLYDVIQTLGDLYAKRRTIVDDMNDLNDFKRKPKEPIHTAMQRAKMMSERVRHLWPAPTWNTHKRMEILLSILRQIITHETKKHVEYEEMKYWKTGTTLEYNAMLDTVETFESTNDQIPTTERKLIINVCTGSPKPIQGNPKHKTDPLHPEGKDKQKGKNQKGKKGKQNVKTANVQPMQTDVPPKTISFQKKRKIDDEGTFQPVTNPEPAKQNQPQSKEGKPQQQKGKGPQKEGPRKVQSGDSQKTQQKPSEKSAINPSTPTFGDRTRYNSRSPSRNSDSSRKENYQRRDERDYDRSRDSRNYSRDRYRSSSRDRYYNDRRDYNRDYGRRRSYSPGYSRNQSPYRSPDRRSNASYTGSRGSGVFTPRQLENWSFCPECQKPHKINTFCPMSGKRSEGSLNL